MKERGDDEYRDKDLALARLVFDMRRVARRHVDPIRSVLEAAADFCETWLIGKLP